MVRTCFPRRYAEASFMHNSDSKPNAYRDERSRALLIALAGCLVLAWSLLTLTELPRYLHDPDIPAWQPATLASCSVFVVLIGLALWIRSGQSYRIAVDKPGKWFARHLKPLPLLIVAAIALIYGLRNLAFTLVGASYWH